MASIAQQQHSFTSQQLLDAAERSPELVAVHDKKEWLALFGPDAVVQDPVGTPPSNSTSKRDRFYETFIAPNQIKFHIQREDIVSIDASTVIRDVVIETTMPSGARIKVPVHLMYEYGNGVLIRRLSAHWEILQSLPVIESLGDVVRALFGYLGATYAMFSVQGFAWTMQYFYGTMSGIGGEGKGTAKAVIADLNSAIGKSGTVSDTFQKLFSNENSECVMSPLSPHFTTPGGILQALQHNAVVSNIVPVKYTSAGFVTTCSLDVHILDASGKEKIVNGMVILEFPGSYEFPEVSSKRTRHGSALISRMRLFWKME